MRQKKEKVEFIKQITYKNNDKILKMTNNDKILKMIEKSCFYK